MLLHGLDEIGRTLQQRDAIAAFERAQPVKRFALAVLPGDGIGPEVTAEALKVSSRGRSVRLPDRQQRARRRRGRRRGAGDSLPERTRAAVVEADAVLLGAVGHPELASAEGKRRPEAGLLALRKLLGVYANLRPVVGPPLVGACVAPPARAARGRGPPHRAGADRRAVLRRAAGAGAGQRGEYHAIHRGGDRASGAGRVPRRGRAARPADVGGQGERAGSVGAVARDGHAGGGGGVPGDQARAPVRGFRRDAPGRGSGRDGRAAHRKSVRRHPER